MYKYWNHISYFSINNYKSIHDNGVPLKNYPHDQKVEYMCAC